MSDVTWSGTARWAELGYRVIGGCFGTTPDHIRVLKETLPGRIG